MVARRANVTVDLADYGRVQSVRVDAGGDRALEGCIRRAVRGWRFSTTLKKQQVKFPVVFR
jgi:outer membrane biosynthesis protein TonB